MAVLAEVVFEVGKVQESSSPNPLPFVSRNKRGRIRHIFGFDRSSLLWLPMNLLIRANDHISNLVTHKV